VLEREGEPTALMESGEGAEAVWLVEAGRSGARSGTVHRVDAGKQELPAGLFRASTHAFGLAERSSWHARSAGCPPAPSCSGSKARASVRGTS
jgi:hypothetical protein